ncbi:hypothetical protein HZS_4243 [Henneguya salminicola]|uniref:thioredoxin-dependent peroxiredoxin n=1 Tax=Henneguya salminicola TaxID=69463 RepID=A0A6G3MDZ7_HENSL|nr:hypothetical protein HZS_4243 [Henneguya salminicola]
MASCCKIAETCECDPCTCPSTSCYENSNSRCFVGEPAPSFESEALLPGGIFGKIIPKSYCGKYVILFFYPLDFTFVCPTEIIAFSDRISEFRALNCEVIAASCDSVYSHHAWTKLPRHQGGLGNLNIPIIADKTTKIAQKYNIYIPDKGISLRGLFIIDGKGILRQIIVNDLPVGRSTDEALRLVQAYKFTDEHGQVCPMDWKKGSKAMDTKKSEEFFTSTYSK